MKIRFNTPENKTPDYDRGMHIQYGEAKRANKPWRWYMILIIASLPLLYLFSLIMYDLIVIEADGRISVPQTTVRAAGDGYIHKILVEPLQMVNAGSELAILSNAQLDANHQRLQKEIAFLTAEEDKLLTRPSDFASTAAQLIAFAREQKDFYRKRLQQYESLFRQGAATQAEIATARSQYNSALENLASLEKARHSDQGTRPETFQIGARIQQLTSDLERITFQKQQLLMLSPEGGLITEIFAQPGEFLGKGQPLLELITPDKTLIHAFIPPKHQDYARVGENVTVTLPNGKSAKAKITSVPGVTRRSLAEDISVLEMPRSTILAYLQFIEPVETQLINGIPVKIKFHHFSR